MEVNPTVQAAIVRMLKGSPPRSGARRAALLGSATGRVASESVRPSNIGRAELYQTLIGSLPDGFARKDVWFTLNDNVVCAPHRDKGNVGHSLVLFLGDYEGGALHLETGQVFETRGVWHGFDASSVVHWSDPISSGRKFSVVAFHFSEPPSISLQVREAGSHQPWRTFASMSEASRRLGMRTGHVSEALRGRRKRVRGQQAGASVFFECQKCTSSL